MICMIRPVFKMAVTRLIQPNADSPNIAKQFVALHEPLPFVPSSLNYLDAHKVVNFPQKENASPLYLHRLSNNNCTAKVIYQLCSRKVREAIRTIKYSSCHRRSYQC